MIFLFFIFICIMFEFGGGRFFEMEVDEFDISHV